MRRWAIRKDGTSNLFLSTSEVEIDWTSDGSRIREFDTSQEAWEYIRHHIPEELHEVRVSVI